MSGNIKDCTTLNNGVRMPWLGFGVWQIEDPEELDSAVKAAIRAGYAGIDTADIYGNEEGVGKAVRESGVLRESLFITTKLWNSAQSQGYEATLTAFETSRKRLGLEYLDLFMIHWPVRDKYVESWKAIVKLYRDGLIRAAGVSNFNVHHIEDIVDATGVVPAVDQVELHPLLSQKPLIEYCKGNGIQVEAYSPLANGHLGEIAGLSGIAAKYGKTTAQVVLRWDLENGIVVIPKSVHETRIVENAGIFDFELAKDDIAAIDGLNQNLRFLPDPDVFGY